MRPHVHSYHLQKKNLRRFNHFLSSKSPPPHICPILLDIKTSGMTSNIQQAPLWKSHTVFLLSEVHLSLVFPPVHHGLSPEGLFIRLKKLNF